jgi:hypothetical protein
MRDFVADMLECEGAVIEPVEPDGLDVLAPEPLRAAMGWPELARLGFGATLPAGAMPIRLEGDWLDRFGALLGERGRSAVRQLLVANSGAPPSQPELLLDRALDLPNATWRLQETGPKWTACLLLSFRYTATSDEKREGLVWLGLNQGTGAIIEGEMLARLRALLAKTEWLAPEPNVRPIAATAWDANSLATRLEPAVAHHVRRDLEGFLGAMRRRLDRDRGRIYDYCDDLRRAAQTKLIALAGVSGEKAESDRKRESARITVIEREYAAKLDDLRHNYALRVAVEWVQALTLVVPVHRYHVLIKRRKGERLVRIDWHPALRMIEPPPCDWGPGVGRTRLLCDEQLHLTDPSGQTPCRSCGKAFCRACHPAACPRCGPPSPGLAGTASTRGRDP